MDTSDIKTSPYDQKLFVQIRIHDAMTLINRLSINPLYFDADFQVPHYEMIFNALKEIYLTISSKLTDKEDEELEKTKTKLQEKIDSGIWDREQKLMQNSKIHMNSTKWNDLRDNLFQYRKLIEKAMEVHKFNPSADAMDFENY